MEPTDSIKVFESVLGYTFNSQDLLKESLLHSSFVNENKFTGLSDNERLEFLGDAVLQLVISEYLYVHYPYSSEGVLTKWRSAVVCRPILSKVGKRLGVGNFLFLGQGEEKTGGRTRASLLGDAMEAIIGAVYLDGGLSAAKRLILREFIPELDAVERGQAVQDYKTMLQEKLQEKGTPNIKYVIIDEQGPDHAKIFTAQVCNEQSILGLGTGHSKKVAEQQAAKQALKILE